MRREALHGGMQGKGNPAYTHRLRPQDFDTPGDRPPTDGPSKWKRIVAFVLFAAVVSVLYVLNVKGR